MGDRKAVKQAVRAHVGPLVLSPQNEEGLSVYRVEGGIRPFSGANVVMPLVAPQGFEPRLDESESSVLPLNEGAKQVFTAAAGSAGATISRLCECTGDMLMGQPLAVHKPYSSRRISSGF